MKSALNSADVSDDNTAIRFRCNICDRINTARLGTLERDNPSCDRCGSSVRLRAIVQVLTTELFGESMSLSQIKPSGPEIKGIGLSC